MPHIFLYGPPGTGKSTIGRKLARRLQLPFVDLDRVIETNAGMSIPQIMGQQGEPAFRNLEASALRETVGHASGVRSQVIALGGGALLREGNRAFVEVGGLISYGPDAVHIFAQVAAYVGRILKGEKPADLPVQQSDKFETAINQKAAKTLGFEIPPKLLFTADHVIE